MNQTEFEIEINKATIGTKIIVSQTDKINALTVVPTAEAHAKKIGCNVQIEPGMVSSDPPIDGVRITFYK